METPAKKSPAKAASRKAVVRKTVATRKAIPRGEKIVAQKKYIQTVGRRKRAVARVRLTLGGDGSYLVNTKKHTDYFAYPLMQEVVTSPLPVVGLEGAATVSVRVEGGGVNAQSEAIRLGLSRALIIFNPEFRPVLRKMGWLTRDSREKERKKPGLKRARRAPQWQKR